MNGRVQVENAALAWLVCDSLLVDAIPDGEKRRKLIESGLGNVLLPGRMEIVSVNPTIVLDAAHTPSSIARLIDSIRSYPNPRYLLFGSVLGKRHKEMAALLAPWFERIIVSTPGTFKPSNPISVAEDFAQLHPWVDLSPDPDEALEDLLAGDEGATRFVTGSFYMVAEARNRILAARGER